MSQNLYAERDHAALDVAGNYYCRHVDHMTREGLHAKSDIAAELGWRDMEIDRLLARVAELERTGSAVVARWDSPNWKDGTHTKDYIDALRAALAKDATP